MTMGDKQRPLGVAVLGCGAVGSQVVRLLSEQRDDLAARVGAPVELVGVAVRRLDAPRDVEVPGGLLTTDAHGLVARDDVDLVVEVIGGIEPARSLILSALENGASVVTANKALLAEDGSTLFAAAEKAGRDLYFEAAVAGAIPILRPLRLLRLVTLLNVLNRYAGASLRGQVAIYVAGATALVLFVSALAVLDVRRAGRAEARRRAGRRRAGGGRRVRVLVRPRDCGVRVDLTARRDRWADRDHGWSDVRVRRRAACPLCASTECTVTHS